MVGDDPLLRLEHDKLVGNGWARGRPCFGLQATCEPPETRVSSSYSSAGTEVAQDIVFPDFRLNVWTNGRRVRVPEI